MTRSGWIDHRRMRWPSWLAGSARIRWACSWRVRDEASSPFEIAGVDELTLSPLPDADAWQILDSRAPDLNPVVRDRIVREAAGNPLALVELSAPSRAIRSAQHGADVLPLSDRLERSFAARTRDLPDDTRWLLLGRRARRSRRDPGDPGGCGGRTGGAEAAVGRRPGRGRCVVAALPSSAHSLRDSAARHARRAAACP
jgi:hypothetical protein